MKALFRYPLLLLLAATTAITIACASGGSSPTSTVEPSTSPAVSPVATSSPTPTATATAVPSPTPSALVRLFAADPSTRDNEEFARVLLSYVPDTAQAREGFWIGDYALAAQLLDIDVPGPADDAAVGQYVYDMTHGDAYVAHGLYLAGFDPRTPYPASRQKTRPYIGFAQADLAYSITVGDDDAALEIVFGDIDPETTSDLILSCEACPAPDRLSHAGLEFFAWGGDAERSLSNRFAPPLFDGAGIGGRLAVADSVAWRTVRTEGMETLLATAAGELPSLADSEDYVELLRAMMEHNAVSVFMSSETVSRAEDPDGFANAMFPEIMTYAQIYGFTEEQVEQLRQTVSAGTFPPPFDTYAVASAWDEDGFHTLVAYIYPSEELAEAALPNVEQRFNEAHTVKNEDPYTELYSPTASVEGRVVVVKLNGNAAEYLVANDPVFAHE